MSVRSWTISSRSHCCMNELPVIARLRCSRSCSSMTRFQRANSVMRQPPCWSVTTAKPPEDAAGSEHQEQQAENERRSRVDPQRRCNPPPGPGGDSGHLGELEHQEDYEKRYRDTSAVHAGSSLKPSGGPERPVGPSQTAWGAVLHETGLKAVSRQGSLDGGQNVLAVLYRSRSRSLDFSGDCRLVGLGTCLSRSDGLDYRVADWVKQILDVLKDTGVELCHDAPIGWRLRYSTARIPGQYQTGRSASPSASTPAGNSHALLAMAITPAAVRTASRRSTIAASQNS